ncbi:skin secretory protein xP2-like [Penaeus japonicus]|uniref:skin secretory protein xP2-like n=1 Tax=Penaeus japonicus TaxID=27405 RepID=UPI001C717049|nr:skin secretory protein xP2-like [Penaeus japonicus]
MRPLWYLAALVACCLLVPTEEYVIGDIIASTMIANSFSIPIALSTYALMKITLGLGILDAISDKAALTTAGLVSGAGVPIPAPGLAPGPISVPSPDVVFGPLLEGGHGHGPPHGHGHGHGHGPALGHGHGHGHGPELVHGHGPPPGHGHGHGPAPGPAPGHGHGSTSGHGPEPVHEHELEPTHGHGPEPAHGHGPEPAHGHGPEPAHGHGPEPAHGHGPEPAHGHGPEPAHGHGPEPAHGHGPEPAHGHGPEPAHGHGPEPAHGHGPEPAHGHGPEPAHGHGPEPAHGHGPEPAHGHFPPPGHGPEPAHGHFPPPGHGPEPAHGHFPPPFSLGHGQEAGRGHGPVPVQGGAAFHPLHAGDPHVRLDNHLPQQEGTFFPPPSFPPPAKESIYSPILVYEPSAQSDGPAQHVFIPYPPDQELSSSAGFPPPLPLPSPHHAVHKRAVENASKMKDLLLAAVSQVDTVGCAPKILCYLRTKSSDEWTSEEKALLVIFAGNTSSKTASTSSAPFVEAMDLGVRSQDPAACDLAYPKCTPKGEDLRQLLKMAGGCTNTIM